jgi:predicted RNA-binding Zn ribbon-like protein
MNGPTKHTPPGGSLDDQLAAHLKQHGNLSSQTVADLARDAAADPDEVDPATAFAESRKTATVAEEDADYARVNSMADMLRAVQQLPQFLINLFAGQQMKLNVSPEDKNRFLAALPENRPFTKTYSVADGRVSFTFRFRSDAESRALWAQLVHETEGATLTKLEYNARLRDLTFALVVQEYNGAEFPPISKDELRGTYRKGADGKFQRAEPGWLERAEFWAEQSPAMLALMFKHYREFEFLYWSLTDGADAGNS